MLPGASGIDGRKRMILSRKCALKVKYFRLLPKKTFRIAPMMRVVVLGKCSKIEVKDLALINSRLDGSLSKEGRS